MVWLQSRVAISRHAGLAISRDPSVRAPTLRNENGSPPGAGTARQRPGAGSSVPLHPPSFELLSYRRPSGAHSAPARADCHLWCTCTLLCAIALGPTTSVAVCRLWLLALWLWLWACVWGEPKPEPRLLLVIGCAGRLRRWGLVGLAWRCFSLEASCLLPVASLLRVRGGHDGA